MSIGERAVKEAKFDESLQIKLKETAPPKKEERELLPHPYFYYRDFSQEIDHDPLTPLTPPGRVPNFPAKM